MNPKNQVHKHPHHIGKMFLRAFTLELIKNSILQIPQHPRVEFQPILVPSLKPQVQVSEPTELQKSILDRAITRMKPSSIREEPKIPVQSNFPQVKINSSLPQNFNLAKLEVLLHDPRVTIIECPGPEKLVLARTSGRTNVTKISLNSGDIQNIIQQFSQEAKIPIISGLFKAAVGNLILTAVISELVGSRFIITKVTPQFFLEFSESMKK